MKNLITWAPRVIALIIIVFILLFAFNGFVPRYLTGEGVVPLVIGILPAVVLFLALVMAWFFRLAGGITWIILGIVMIIFFHTYRDELSFLTLSSPVVAVGVLFVLSHFYDKAGTAK